MTSRCKAAIFDMDGTLLNSMRFWRLVGMEYLIAHDLPIPSMDVNDYFRRSSRAQVVSVLEDLGMNWDDGTLVGELEGRMAKYYRTDVRPKPGAEAFLRALNERGVACAVATATPREVAEEALERHGLLKYFQFVTDSYEIGLSKSDPAYFRAVAERLGAELQECWMFEDAVYAMRGARAAGMRVCAIEDWTAGGAEEIPELSDVYARTFEDLLPDLSWLERPGKGAKAAGKPETGAGFDPILGDLKRPGRQAQRV